MLVIQLNDDIDPEEMPGIEQFLIERLGDIGISASSVTYQDDACNDPQSLGQIFGGGY
jgi:hypothetical protein